MKFYGLKKTIISILFFLLCIVVQIILAKTSFITDDDLGIDMIGGIISRTSKDFNKQVTNKKSVLLLKVDGNLGSYKIAQSFNGTYKKKPKEYTLSKIYNKYHMEVSYGKKKKQEFLQVVRVGFSNKRAKIPKPKKEAPPKKLISGVHTEDGFERNFDDASGQITMTQGYRENIKKNLSTILMQASANPVVDHGEIVGFMLEEIDKSSMYEKAGFKNGDIVTSINGMPLTNAATAIKILNTLKDTDNIDFEFLRQGQSYQVNAEVQ